jgi:hypothetical protein
MSRTHRANKTWAHAKRQKPYAKKLRQLTAIKVDFY